MKKTLLTALVSLITLITFAQIRPSPLKKHLRDTISLPVIEHEWPLCCHPERWPDLTGAGYLAGSVTSMGTFESWPSSGVVIRGDTLQITGNKIRYIIVNGEKYTVSPGDINIRTKYDPSLAKRVIDSVFDFPIFILPVNFKGQQ